MRSSLVSQSFLLAASLILTGSILLGLSGCADAFSYASDSHRQGMGLYNEGNYTDAAAAFENATRQDPRAYKSYYYAGASYQAQKKYQQAIASYRGCLEVMPLTLAGKNDKPLRLRALDSLATVIAKSQSSGQETASLEKKCQSQPSVEDQWLLAKIYRYGGDGDNAINAYSAAVRLDAGNFDLAKEAGLYQEQLGQKEKATYALKKAYAVKSDDEQVNAALHRLGVVLGPSLKDERDLAQPALPNGPLPEVGPRRTPGGDDQTIQTPRD